MRDHLVNALIWLARQKIAVLLLSLFFFWSAKHRKQLRKRIALLVNHSYVERAQSQLIEKLKDKKTVTAAFLAIDTTLWPYDELYKLLEKNPRFHPVIVVIPHQGFEEEHRKKTYSKTFDYFKNKGFRVLSSWDENTRTYHRLEDLVQPDLIFYTSPYDISLPQYNIHKWYTRALTCYVPYGIMQANIQQTQYNQRFHNLIWRCFYETELHRQMAQKYAANKGRNVVVTGYPKMDVFLSTNYKPKDVWNTKNKKAKRIIWAPHHTIESGLNFSNFLEYADFFINLLKKYPQDIHIAFKPHPNLKEKLCKHKDWGQVKTDAYYKLWETLPNAQLEEGDYTDLFLLSDALIHDSVSFIAEYTYINKPMLFMLKDSSVAQKFNEFGLKLFETVSTSSRQGEVERFISQVLQGQNDPKQSIRSAFVNKYLKEPTRTRGKTASENIMDELMTLNAEGNQ